MQRSLSKQIILIWLVPVLTLFSFYFYKNEETWMALLCLSTSFLVLVFLIIWNFSTLKNIINEPKTWRLLSLRYRTLAYTCLVILAYGLIYFDIIRFEKDLSQEKLYSISDYVQTELKKINQPLELLAFTIPAAEPRFEDVFDLFCAQSKNLKCKMVDPNKEAQLAQQYKIGAAVPSVIVVNSEKETFRIHPGEWVSMMYSENGGRKRMYRYEEILFKTIQTALGRKTRQVYWLLGEGQRDPRLSEAQLELFWLSLQNEGYSISFISNHRKLKDKPKGMILNVAPQRDAPASFLNWLRTVNDWPQAHFVDLIATKSSGIPGWENYLKELGVQLLPGILVDTRHYLERVHNRAGSPFFPRLELTGAEYLKPVRNSGQGMVHFYSRGLRTLSNDRFQHEALIQSSDNAYLDTSLMKQGAFEENKEALRKNWLTDVLIGQKNSNTHFAYVSGDSDFLSDSVWFQGAHRDFVLLTFDYLSLGKQNNQLRPKVSRLKALMLSREERQIMIFIYLVILPVLIIAIGLSVNILRKEKTRPKETKEDS